MAIRKVMLIIPLTPGMLVVIIMLMMAILRKVYDDLFPSVAALPGVARLVHHLAKHQVRSVTAILSIIFRVHWLLTYILGFQTLYLILGLQCKACPWPCKTPDPCQQHLSLSIIFCSFWLQCKASQVDRVQI